MIGSIDRIEQHTDPEVNKHIRKQMDRSITYFRHHKDQVGERLEELEQEWSTDRVIQAMGGAISVTGAVLTLLTGKRRFAVMSAMAGSFLLMYSIAGWAPPLPLLRKWGVRTQAEIDDEVCALALQQEQ